MSSCDGGRASTAWRSLLTIALTTDDQGWRPTVLRRVVASSLVVSLTLMGYSWAAGPVLGQVPSASGESEAMERLDRFHELLLELRSHLDRSQFDLDALLERLDHDPDEILRFVTEEIYFEQYPGLLRGAQGTLMARAGNALDQAVLLATLLKDAGRDARIARVTLGPEQAALLIRQMNVERRPAPTIGDLEKIREVLRRMLDLVGAAQNADELLDRVGTAPDVRSTDVYARAVADRDWLLAQLDQAKVRVGDPEALDRITTEARDYFWVEHRAGSEPWRSAHPAFDEPMRARLNLEVVQHFTEEIPPELQHRFRFEVVLERRMGERTEEVPILSGWEHPVANLVGEPLTYTNVPDSWLENIDVRELEAALDRADLFLPLFNVKQRGDEAFDVAGMTAQIDAAATAAAGALRTVSSKLSSAGAAVGALGREDSSAEAGSGMTELLQQRLEFTFIAPGGREERFVRRVLPEAGSAPTLEMKRRLAVTHTFMLAPGSYPEAYVIDRMIDQHRNNRPLVEVHLKKALDPVARIVMPSEALSAVDLRSLEHLLLYPLFDAGAAGDLTYRPVASLVVVSRGLPADGAAPGIVDIVRNQRRSFSRSDGVLSPSFQASLSTGVWESHAEELALGAGQEEPFSAARAFRAARDSKVGIVTLKPGETSSVDALGVSEVARKNLRIDLEAGFAVMVPRETPSGRGERTGWWRIDPASGETLAVGDDGRGVSLTEEGILTLVLGIAALGLAAAGGVGLFSVLILSQLVSATERILSCVAFDVSSSGIYTTPICE